MREYCGDIHFICLEAQTLFMKQSSSKVFFITQLGHSVFLTTIALIVIFICDD